MKKNKLIELLLTFSGHQLVRFRKYVVSPFFNENRELVQVFDVLRPAIAAHKKTGQLLDKVGLWAEIFPGRPYSDTRFRRLNSDLLRLALDFLAWSQYARSTNPSHALLDALAGTPLKKHFSSAVRQMKKQLDEAGLRDANYHFSSFYLQRKLQEQQEHTPDKAALSDHLQKAAYHLDCFYLAKKLEQYTDSLGYQDIMADVQPIALLPGLEDFIKKSPYLNEPAVRAWYLVVLMRLHPGEEDYYFQLKNLLEEKGGLFTKKELHTFFIHLMNYCIYTKINKNRPDYYEELFTLYLISLEKEIIFINKQLNPHHYKNIITISLRLEKFDWVESFIEKYTHLLPEADKERASCRERV